MENRKQDIGKTKSNKKKKRSKSRSKSKSEKPNDSIQLYTNYKKIWRKVDRTRKRINLVLSGALGILLLIFLLELRYNDSFNRKFLILFFVGVSLFSTCSC